MHQGEDVRVRVEQAELLEHALAAAQPGEPVVHERNLHRAASRYASACCRAHSSQRNAEARSSPLRDSSALSAASASTRSSWAAAPPRRRGESAGPRPPETSSSAGIVAGDAGRATGHGLHQREPESFVQRGQDQHRRGAIEAHQLFVAHVSVSRPRQLQGGARGQRGTKGVESLARPGIACVEHEVAPAPAPREKSGVHAVVDGPHPLHRHRRGAATTSRPMAAVGTITRAAWRALSRSARAKWRARAGSCVLRVQHRGEVVHGEHHRPGEERRGMVGLVIDGGPLAQEHGGAGGVGQRIGEGEPFDRRAQAAGGLTGREERAGADALHRRQRLEQPGDVPPHAGARRRPEEQR